MKLFGELCGGNAIGRFDAIKMRACRFRLTVARAYGTHFLPRNIAPQAVLIRLIKVLQFALHLYGARAAGWFEGHHLFNKARVLRQEVRTVFGAGFVRLFYTNGMQ